VTVSRDGAGGELVNGSPGPVSRLPAGRESYDDRQCAKSLTACAVCGVWAWRARPVCVACRQGET